MQTPTGTASWPAARCVVPWTSPSRNSVCIACSKRRMSSIRPYASRYAVGSTVRSVVCVSATLVSSGGAAGGRGPCAVGRIALGGQPVGHRRVLGTEVQAGGLRLVLEQRGEVDVVVAVADEALHDLLGGGRDRHRDLELARGVEAEVEVLEQQRGREGRREVEVHVGGRLVAREHRAHDAVVEER